jgi:probable F420-dependent oxidoreductase
MSIEGRVKFSLGLSGGFGDEPDDSLTGDAVAAVARAAEEGGFYSLHAADHPLPSNEWLNSGGHHSPDPFVTLAFAAAHTTRVRVMTNVLVLPYRHPAVVAKSIATLDRLSGGRTIMGVGAGYEVREFEALGVAFADRNLLTDQSLQMINKIWAGTLPGHDAEPTPVQRPRPPVWVGGNSRIAMRRAVDVADGWMPMVNPAVLSSRRRTSTIETVDDLSRRIDEMRRYSDEIHRDSYPVLSFTNLAPLPLSFNAKGVSTLLKEIEALSELDVRHIRIEMKRRSESELVEAIGEFASQVISRFDDAWGI